MVRSTEDRLQDILATIASIEARVTSTTPETFAATADSVKALAYDLLIIGEAASHLPAEMRDRHPEIP